MQNSALFSNSLFMCIMCGSMLSSFTSLSVTRGCSLSFQINWTKLKENTNHEHSGNYKSENLILDNKLKHILVFLEQKYEDVWLQKTNKTKKLKNTYLNKNMTTQCQLFDFLLMERILGVLCVRSFVNKMILIVTFGLQWYSHFSLSLEPNHEFIYRIVNN